MLSNADFKHLIAVAPLVSVDLIIRNRENEILLGYRKNAPAKNTWFVPGGRIMKNERIENAFERITLAETGRTIAIKEATFKGVYQHLYPNDNVFGDPSIDTHYIVLAYELTITDTSSLNLDSQHDRFKWMPIPDLVSDPSVHHNTRAYFL